MSYEYRVVRLSDRGSFETQVNRVAKEGFRVSHFAVTKDPDRNATYYALMEKE